MSELPSRRAQRRGEPRRGGAGATASPGASSPGSESPKNSSLEPELEGAERTGRIGAPKSPAASADAQPGSAPSGSEPPSDAEEGEPKAGRSKSRSGGSASRRATKVSRAVPARRTGSIRAVKEDDDGKTGSGRHPKVSQRREKADGSQDGGSFQKGAPLAVKIGGITALMVAVLMVGLGAFLFNISVNELENQINLKGVVAANELASFADPIFWFNPAPEEIPESAWKSQRRERILEWQGKLKKLVADEQSDYVYASIADPQQGPLTIMEDDGQERRVLFGSLDGADMPPDLTEQRTLGRYSGVEVAEGRHPQHGRVRHFVAKVFARPAGRSGEPAPDAEHKAYAHVYMKANEVDEVRGEVLLKVAVGTGAGLGIAIVLSIVMSMFLAGPLKGLVSDMRIVARGNLEHKTVPRSSDEIGYVAHQFNEMTRSLRNAQKLEHERAAMENELSIATEIQAKLLPERVPQIPGFDIHSHYASAKRVGGDYYDFLVIDAMHLGIVIADVSGKGIPGAMVMTMVRGLLRLASQNLASPGETLKRVNRTLAKDIRRGMFVTAIYGVLNIQTRELTMCSAGHNPMLHYRAETGDCVQINPNGIALGFDKGRTFDDNLQEQVVKLKAGDKIVLYTDGVNEARNAEGEELGLDPCQDVLLAAKDLDAKATTQHLVQRIDEHRGKAEQSDDITIVTLRVG